MEVTISNEIIVKHPTEELIEWARKNLIFENPEYISRVQGCVRCVGSSLWGRKADQTILERQQNTAGSGG